MKEIEVFLILIADDITHELKYHHLPAEMIVEKRNRLDYKISTVICCKTASLIDQTKNQVPEVGERDFALLNLLLSPSSLK